MIKINRITEPISLIVLNNETIGEIHGLLEFNDVCIQIKEQKLSGYSIVYENNEFPIDSSGRVLTKGFRPYPLLGQQLRKLI